MNYDTNTYLKGILLFLVLCTFSCKKQLIVPENDITKETRILLGNTLVEAIAANPEVFPLVSRIDPSHQSAFKYFDALYLQAYFTLRDDPNASNLDRWDSSIKWDFNVINSNEKMAFCLPGGNFYITLGMLELIRNEHQLFYVMTFEAMIMNERKLLSKLAAVNNPKMLSEIAETGQSSAGTTALDLVKEIFNSLTYEDFEMEEIDIKTVQSICNRSQYKPTGINEMVPDLNALWYQTRPNYPSRQSVIISETQTGGCGNETYALYSTFYKRTVESLK